MLGELTSIGRHGIEKASLAFREDNVEGESRFPASTESSDYHKRIPRNSDIDVFQIMFPGSSNLNSILSPISGRVLRPVFFRSDLFLAEEGGEVEGGLGRSFHNLLGRSFRDNPASFRSSSGAHINQVVCRFDDIEVMLDDDQRMPNIYQPIENNKKLLNVAEVQASSGLIEHQQLGGSLAT